MFNKLISSLPFNPSLINQVSFYAKRLKQETSVRRLGFILIVLTMFLQLFAVFSPAQPTLARAGNDIVPGGFQSKSELVTLCRNNTYGLNTIVGHFGISCNNLQNNSSVTTIHAQDSGNNLYSMGRLPQGAVNVNTGKVTNEVPIKIGLSTFYMRLLSSWDRPGTNSSYTALSVGNVFGVHYYILFSCGNIVQIGKPGPPPPPARPVPPPPAPKPKPTPTPTPTPIPHPKDVCPLIPGIQTQKSQCLPCLQSKNDTDVNSCLLPYKRAKNVTQNISAANRTTAHAGDTITYVLYLQNRGRVAAKTIVVENMTDVLEYANITNLHGGTISQNDNVSWPQQVIPAKTTISHEITVQVKSPIPQTPSPCPPKNLVSHCPQSGSFDLIMTNTYGNTINIHLPRSITKTTEKVTTTTLPNTGPGTSIAVGFGLTAIVGYFFARSRLLTQELDIIRKEYTVSGGM